MGSTETGTVEKTLRFEKILGGSANCGFSRWVEKVSKMGLDTKTGETPKNTMILSKIVCENSIK